MFNDLSWRLWLWWQRQRDRWRREEPCEPPLVSRFDRLEAVRLSIDHALAESEMEGGWKWPLRLQLWWVERKIRRL